MTHCLWVLSLNINNPGCLSLSTPLKGSFMYLRPWYLNSKSQSDTLSLNDTNSSSLMRSTDSLCETEWELMLMQCSRKFTSGPFIDRVTISWHCLLVCLDVVLVLFNSTFNAWIASGATHNYFNWLICSLQIYKASVHVDASSVNMFLKQCICHLFDLSVGSDDYCATRSEWLIPALLTQ